MCRLDEQSRYEFQEEPERQNQTGKRNTVSRSQRPVMTEGQVSRFEARIKKKQKKPEISGKKRKKKSL